MTDNQPFWNCKKTDDVDEKKNIITILNFPYILELIKVSSSLRNILRLVVTLPLISWQMMELGKYQVPVTIPQRRTSSFSYRSYQDCNI